MSSASLLSVGMSLAIAPLTTLVLTSVESDRAGTASGVNSAVSRTVSLFACSAASCSRAVLSCYRDSIWRTAVAAVACLPATLVVFIIEPRPHIDFIPRD